MTGQSTINPYLLAAKTQSGADYVTDNMIDGAEQKKNEYYNIKAVDEAMKQWNNQINQGLLSPQQHPINNLAAQGAREAVALKQGWENANAQKQEAVNQIALLDEAYNSADSDEKRNVIEAQRQQLSMAIPKLDKAMADMHDGMVSLQQSYENAGYDLGRYGSGVSLQDATQNLQNDTLSTINRIVNDMPSSDEYYLQVKQNLMDQGASEEYARERAGREAAMYKAKRLSQLRDGFHGFGVGDNGAVTNQGMELLSLLGAEDADSANMLLNSYALPKNDYATARAEENALRQIQAAKEKALLENNLKRQLEAQKAEEKMRQLAYSNDRADNRTYNSIAMRGAYGIGSSGKRRSGSDGETRTKREKLADSLDNDWKAARSQVDSGDHRKVAKTLSKAINRVAKLWRAAELTDEEYMYYYNRLKLLNDNYSAGNDSSGVLIPWENRQYDTEQGYE